MEQMSKEEYMALNAEVARRNAEVLRDTILPALREVLEASSDKERAISAEEVAADKAARAEAKRENMRDAFACQALQGFLSGPSMEVVTESAAEAGIDEQTFIVRSSYQLADAMLLERERK